MVLGGYQLWTRPPFRVGHWTQRSGASTWHFARLSRDPLDLQATARQAPWRHRTWIGQLRQHLGKHRMGHLRCYLFDETVVHLFICLSIVSFGHFQSTSNHFHSSQSNGIQGLYRFNTTNPGSRVQQGSPTQAQGSLVVPLPLPAKPRPLLGHPNPSCASPLGQPFFFNSLDILRTMYRNRTNTFLGRKPHKPWISQNKQL